MRSWDWADQKLVEENKFLSVTEILSRCTASKTMNDMCTEEFWYRYWRSKPQSMTERTLVLLQMVSRTDNDQYNNTLLEASMRLYIDLNLVYDDLHLIQWAITRRHIKLCTKLLKHGLELGDDDTDFIRTTYMNPPNVHENLTIFLPFMESGQIKYILKSHLFYFGGVNNWTQEAPQLFPPHMMDSVKFILESFSLNREDLVDCVKTIFLVLFTVLLRGLHGRQYIRIVKLFIDILEFIKVYKYSGLLGQEIRLMFNTINRRRNKTLDQIFTPEDRQYLKDNGLLALVI